MSLKPTKTPSRYCSDHIRLNWEVAADVMAWTMAVSARGDVCELTTSSVACCAAIGSSCVPDATDPEKPSGIVTDAAYRPSERPASASSSSDSTHVTFCCWSESTRPEDS